MCEWCEVCKHACVEQRLVCVRVSNVRCEGEQCEMCKQVFVQAYVSRCDYETWCEVYEQACVHMSETWCEVCEWV